MPRLHARRDVVVVVLEPGFQQHHGFVGGAFLDERDAERARDLGGVRLQLARGAQLFDGAVAVSHLLEQEPELQPAEAESRVELDSAVSSRSASAGWPSLRCTRPR